MKKEEFFRTYYCPASMETAELARKLNQEEAEHVLRTADAVRRHSFLFDMNGTWNGRMNHWSLVTAWTGSIGREMIRNLHGSSTGIVFSFAWAKRT